MAQARAHFWPKGMPVTCTWWNSCETKVKPLKKYVCAPAQLLDPKI